MLKVLGVAIILLGLGIAILPQFTTCQSQGRYMTMANGQIVPMKCLWTARAEIVAGVPILAVGAMTVFSRKKESLIFLGILGVILGALVILLPTSLIGVCNGSMLCDTVMKPTLVSLGSLVIAASLIGLFLSFRNGE